MLHLAQLRAHWGSCGKFWEPGGTKALIYLYDRENTARSKLVQIMWGNKRKRSLRTQILQMVETTARGRNTPRYRFMARIKYARGSRDIHLTLRRAVTWSEWWMPPVIFRQSAGGVSLKQGTSSLITLVKLLICHQLMMRWAGTSKKLRWRALSVWMWVGGGIPIKEGNAGSASFTRRGVSTSRPAVARFIICGAAVTQLSASCTDVGLSTLWTQVRLSPACQLSLSPWLPMTL